MCPRFLGHLVQDGLSQAAHHDDGISYHDDTPLAILMDDDVTGKGQPSFQVGIQSLVGEGRVASPDG